MKLIRIQGVKEVFGHRSATSIYNNLNAGLLTKPILIGQRAVAWPEHEIQAIAGAMVAGQTRDQIRALVTDLTARRVIL
jgi:prophage regulatory protein